MSSGERPIGAAKGKQPNTEALCQPAPPPRAVSRSPTLGEEGARRSRPNGTVLVRWRALRRRGGGPRGAWTGIPGSIDGVWVGLPSQSAYRVPQGHGDSLWGNEHRINASPVWPGMTTAVTLRLAPDFNNSSKRRVRLEVCTRGPPARFTKGTISPVPRQLPDCALRVPQDEHPVSRCWPCQSNSAPGLRHVLCTFPGHCRPPSEAYPPLWADCRRADLHQPINPQPPVGWRLDPSTSPAANESLSAVLP